ncbi:MAG: metallophosphoesterase family protein [Nitrospirota bacterium]
MRYAIISDIHSNLEAFDAVEKDLQKEGADKIFFLGDVVGYGPNPNECIERLRELTDIVVAGNHDYAVIGYTDISYFNKYAKAAIEWTEMKLKAENAEYLKRMPLVTPEIENMTLVHATPNKPHEWNYITTLFDALENFNFFKQQICFIGHSHQPVIIALGNDKRCYVERGESVAITADARYIINIGSVGQPRDGNPDSAYAIYDTDEKSVRIKRLSYDIKKVQAKMRDERLPAYLIHRLEEGL